MANFGALGKGDPDLLDLCVSAERLYYFDQRASIVAARTAAEGMVRFIAARQNIAGAANEGLSELVELLHRKGVLTTLYRTRLHSIRSAGNSAAHPPYKSSPQIAHNCLASLHEVAVWIGKSVAPDDTSAAKYKLPEAPSAITPQAAEAATKRAEEARQKVESKGRTGVSTNPVNVSVGASSVYASPNSRGTSMNHPGNNNPYSQVPFGVQTSFGGRPGSSLPRPSLEFATNAEPRLPCVLLLDNSGSMMGDKIVQLNQGIQELYAQLKSDPLAGNRVELACVSFGPVNEVHDFKAVSQLTCPVLSAESDTPMGQAVCRGLDMLDSRRSVYRGQGVRSYRPWLFLITDGAPTDDGTPAYREAIQRAQAFQGLQFYAIGVEGADFQKLKDFVSDPWRLRGLNFREMFQFISSSLSVTSRGKTTDAPQRLRPRTISSVEIV